MTARCFLTAQAHMGDKKGRALLAALLGDATALRACYIGGAHGDDPGFTKREVTQLQALGLTVVAPRLSDPSLDRAAAAAAIAEADLLYLAGGDTVVLCDAVRDHDLGAAFAAAHAHARLVYGVSGGTCAMAPYTIGYRDDDTPCVAACLGLGAPLPLDVHDEAEDWPELRALLELVQDRPDAAGIAIPSGAALIVEADGSLTSYGRRGCERRRLDAAGAWIIEPIAPTAWAPPA